MIRKTFRMTLKEGMIDEYKKKHDEVWSEISAALTNAGVTNYSIYFDKKDNTLIEYMELKEKNTFDKLEELDILKKWNAYMKDLLVTISEDNAMPVVNELMEVFHHV
jgi:L-rhamnose mutarotase